MASSGSPLVQTRPMCIHGSDTAHQSLRRGEYQPSLASDPPLTMPQGQRLERGPEPINLSCELSGWRRRRVLCAGAGARCALQLVVQPNKPSPTRPLRRLRPSPRPDRADHRGCSTDALPGSRLPGRPLGWTGRTPLPPTSQLRPGIPRRAADRGRSGRPDRLKTYKSSWQTFWQTAATGPRPGKSRAPNPAWPAGLGWSPPPESNRRPHPYHRCAGGSQRQAAPHNPPR
jgi:hypothetical protein